MVHVTGFRNLVDAVGVEPTQSYLSAGGLQPLELANAQHIHKNRCPPSVSHRTLE
jgi:hypothetical protein